MVRRLIDILGPLLLVVAPYFMIGAVIGAIPGYALYRYMWYDDDACISCHVHDYATVGWKENIHGQLTTCHDCHHQSLRAYALSAVSQVTKNPKFPKDLHHMPHVNTQICEACHLTEPEHTSSIAGPMRHFDVAKLPKVDQLYLHELHLRMETRMPLPKFFPLGKEKYFGVFDPEEVKADAEKEAAETPFVEQKTSERRKIACMDCHGGPANRAHDFSVADRSCVRCHSTTHRTDLVKKMGCRTCHYQDFVTPVSVTLPQKGAVVTK